MKIFGKRFRVTHCRSQEENIDELRKLIYEKAKEVHVTRFPYNDFLFYDYDGYNPEDYGQTEELDE